MITPFLRSVHHCSNSSRDKPLCDSENGIKYWVDVVDQLNHHCFRFINIHYYTPKTKENKILTIIKLITNRWAWELVPKRLAGCQMPSCRGGIHGNPGTREPPKRAPTNRHRHTETISGNNLPENTYPDDPTQKREGGEGARIRNDSQ